MAVPKRKISKSKRNMRRAHYKDIQYIYIKCKRCNNIKLRHHICQICGYYK